MADPSEMITDEMIERYLRLNLKGARRDFWSAVMWLLFTVYFLGYFIWEGYTETGALQIIAVMFIGVYLWIVWTRAKEWERTIGRIAVLKDFLTTFHNDAWTPEHKQYFRASVYKAYAELAAAVALVQKQEQ